jgi:hypothetical protein
MSHLSHETCRVPPLECTRDSLTAFVSALGPFGESCSDPRPPLRALQSLLTVDTSAPTTDADSRSRCLLVTATCVDWTLSVLEAHGHVPGVTEDGLRLLAVLARLGSTEAGWQAHRLRAAPTDSLDPVPDMENLSILVCAAPVVVTLFLRHGDVSAVVATTGAGFLRALAPSGLVQVMGEGPTARDGSQTETAHKPIVEGKPPRHAPAHMAHMHVMRSVLIFAIVGPLGKLLARGKGCGRLSMTSGP